MEKAIELEELLTDEEEVVLCLTETQQKYLKVEFSNALVRLDKMREINDKKGGGLTVLMKKQNGVLLQEIECEDWDVMRVEIKSRSTLLNILLVYVDGKTKSRAEKTYKCLNKEIEKLKERDNIIILGDFNGHVGFLGPQRLDEKGHSLLNLVEKWNLVMLNGDQRCLGEITRVQGKQRSTIDVLVNQCAYNIFTKMEVDEDKKKFDLSDHCLIEVLFHGKENSSQTSRGGVVTNNYYRTNNLDLKKLFLQKMEMNIIEEERKGRVIGQDAFETILKDKCEEVLKKKITRREYNNRNGQKKVEPVWMNEEIRKGIKIRKQYNRDKRYAEGERKEIIENKYKEQKNKVQMMIKKEKSEHKKKITNEIKQEKDNGKKMFELIKKLRGNEYKENYQEKNIVFEKGIELSGDKMITKMYEYWSTIYRKQRNDLSQEWNDNEKNKYLYHCSNKQENWIMAFNKDKSIFTVPSTLEEHFDMLGTVIANERKDTKSVILERVSFPADLLEHMEVLKGDIVCEGKGSMKWQDLKKNEVKEALRKIKTGKQPGPDMICGEILSG